jgi:carboxymethylenebutenolidase
MAETEVTIPTPDGAADGYLYRPPGPGPWPGVLFFMDGVGLRGALRDMATRLCEAGYVVLLPNLYYRSGPVRELDYEKDRARFTELAMSIPRGGDARTQDMGAYLSFLAARDGVKPGKLGCMGYCMGAGFSLGAAGSFPAQIGAAGCFHGGGLATDRPDSPHRRAHAIRGKVYVGVAGIDPHLAPGETDRLRGALEGAAVNHRLEIYESVEHGFAVPDAPVYDKPAAERHWEALLGLFKEAL